MFLWNPSSRSDFRAPLETPENIIKTKRLKNSPTPRIWTRFQGVSGCSGFGNIRKNSDGRVRRMRLSPAKKRKTPIAKIANPLSGMKII
jgi:hypothetical protein